ncbi:non-hydrolyzing UDP-N-acetylglucosamine 2-epimerase [Polaribacter sp.]|uniref:non-hydrolyzing UDP-N-acetylglucosamine 2-epimerase n=1 Tax=Polaribacter sp. TaxID=1920175 RepID=UPI0040474FC3
MPKYLLKNTYSSHGAMTGNMLIEIEKILLAEKPDLVLVYGDTNSTLAGSLAAAKLNIPIAHVEAGLRSFNNTMPEEINRVITDRISNFLFCPSKESENNLKRDGIFKNVYVVGDIMFDSLLLAKKYLGDKILIKDQILLTLHRPYNTDDFDRLISLLVVLDKLKFKIIFPIHPRTKIKFLENQFDYSLFKNITIIDPLSYFDFIKLQLESTFIITDSGGVQKEAYWLKKQCVTIRSETEWVETLENGWNSLIFNDFSRIPQLLKSKPGNYLENIYGSGSSSDLISEILNKAFEVND